MQIEQGVVTTLERSKNSFAQKYSGLKESVDVTPKTIEGCVAVRPYDLSSRGGESRLEEGEIEFSQTAGGAGEDMLMDLSQHSSIGGDVTEDGAGEEELLDYEEDPSALAQIQMADLERKVEERVTKLIEDKRVSLPGVSVDGTQDSKTSNDSSNKSGEDSDEMDWGSALDAISSYKDKEFEQDIEKLSSIEGVRRSTRSKSNSGKVQEMAEAIKKKKNDISGNTSINSTPSSQLISVAATCNISLGNSPSKIASVISSFQANELARAALQAAKKRVANQTNADKIESADVGGDCRDVSTTGVEVERPPRKPPRRGRSQNRKKDDAGVNRDTNSDL
jgi:hypothetical protein